MISKLDVLLLSRVGKILAEEAAIAKRSHTPWSGSAESRAQKRRYDRMQREIRDLADLRNRLTGQLVVEVLASDDKSFRA